MLLLFWSSKVLKYSGSSHSLRFKDNLGGIFFQQSSTLSCMAVALPCCLLPSILICNFQLILGFLLKDF